MHTHYSYNLLTKQLHTYVQGVDLCECEDSLITQVGGFLDPKLCLNSNEDQDRLACSLHNRVHNPLSNFELNTINRLGTYTSASMFDGLLSRPSLQYSFISLQPPVPGQH